MAASIVVPVNAQTLPEHEQLDNAAHEQLANTEDEDYKWLTDRLDALTAELAELRSSSQSRHESLSELLSSNQSQSRTLIEVQSQMIQTLLESVTNLSNTALLNSTPQIPPVTQPETATVVVMESAPEDVAVTADKDAPAKDEKKRRRI